MIERGSRILRANGASLNAAAEDEFKQQTVMLPFKRWHICWGEGGIFRNTVLPFILAEFRFFPLLGLGQVQTRWSGSERIFFDLTLDPESWNWMTSPRTYLLSGIQAWLGDFSARCPGGERPRIEGMADGGCQDWELISSSWLLSAFCYIWFGCEGWQMFKPLCFV